MDPRQEYPQDESVVNEPQALVPEPTNQPLDAEPVVPSVQPVTVSEATPDVEPTTAPLPLAAQQFTAQPAPSSPPAEPAPTKSNKKLFIIGGIVAAFLVLGGGGSALAYNMWYQNPDKVLVDSAINLLKSKSLVGDGSINYTSKEGDFSVVFDTKSNNKDGSIAAKVSVNLKEPAIKLDVSGEGIYVDGDIYLKVKDLEKSYKKVANTYVDIMAEAYGQEVTQEMRDTAIEGIDEQFAPIVKKIDNKWIKISSADLKDTSEEADKTKTCLSDTMKKLQDDDKMSKEIAELYRQNKFVVVKEQLGTKDGSLGYLIDVDEKAAKRFGKDFADTTFAKELVKCDDSINFDQTESSASDDSFSDTRAEVWVDKWSHQLTKVSLEGTSKKDDSKMELVYNSQVNKAVSIEAPKDFMTFKQLQDDLTSGFSAFSI